MNNGFPSARTATVSSPAPSARERQRFLVLQRPEANLRHTACEGRLVARQLLACEADHADVFGRVLDEMVDGLEHDRVRPLHVVEGDGHGRSRLADAADQ